MAADPIIKLEEDDDHDEGVRPTQDIILPESLYALRPRDLETLRYPVGCPVLVVLLQSAQTEHAVQMGTVDSAFWDYETRGIKYKVRVESDQLRSGYTNHSPMMILVSEEDLRFARDTPVWVTPVAEQTDVAGLVVYVCEQREMNQQPRTVTYSVKLLSPRNELQHFLPSESLRFRPEKSLPPQVKPDASTKKATKPLSADSIQQSQSKNSIVATSPTEAPPDMNPLGDSEPPLPPEVTFATPCRRVCMEAAHDRSTSFVHTITLPVSTRLHTPLRTFRSLGRTEHTSTEECQRESEKIISMTSKKKRAQDEFMAQENTKKTKKQKSDNRMKYTLVLPEYVNIESMKSALLDDKNRLQIEKDTKCSLSLEGRGIHGKKSPLNFRVYVDIFGTAREDIFLAISVIEQIMMDSVNALDEKMILMYDIASENREWYRSEGKCLWQRGPSSTRQGFKWQWMCSYEFPYVKCAVDAVGIFIGSKGKGIQGVLSDSPSCRALATVGPNTRPAVLLSGDDIQEVHACAQRCEERLKWVKKRLVGNGRICEQAAAKCRYVYRQSC